MPSISLKIKACIAENCKSIDFYEKTGIYDAGTNPGGYGAPNWTVGAAISAVVKIYLPGSDLLPVSSPSATIDLFGPPFPTSDVDLSASILNTDVGLGLNDTFPDGITRIRYEARFTQVGPPAQDTTYAVDSLILVSCGAQCCIDKMFAALDPCNCSCEMPAYKKAMRARNFLVAAIKNACCGQVDNAAKNLQMALDVCNGNCGCK